MTLSDLILRWLVPTFDVLYRSVESSIQDAKPAPECRRWIELLLKGFREEYEQWSRDEEIREYLAAFDQKPRRPLYALMARIHLHIAYDLPRVLAQNWPEPDRSPRLFDDLSFSDVRPPGEEACWREYLKLNFLFPEAVRSCAPRFLRGSVPNLLFVTAAACFAIPLRQEAWHLGREIHKASMDGAEKAMIAKLKTEVMVKGRAFLLSQTIEQALQNLTVPALAYDKERIRPHPETSTQERI